MTERISAVEFRGLAAGKPAAKRSKFGNRKTKVDGITFDSAKEARRYSQLRLLERGGAIRDLRLQVAFRLEVNGSHVCDYVADFVYEDAAEKEVGYTRWVRVVEDTKGFRTPDYKIKAKLMKACLGITILET